MAGDERLFFTHEKTNRDRDLWPDDWFRVDKQNDPRFDQDAENTWGDWVPAESEGGWPSTDEAAKTMFMEQVAEHGCPFHWLIEALQTQ